MFTSISALVISLLISYIAFRIFKSILSAIISFLIIGFVLLCGFTAWSQGITEPNELLPAVVDTVKEVWPKSSRDSENATRNNEQGLRDGNQLPKIVDPLDSDTPSTINNGSVKYGAKIVLGELDHLNRSTFSHIRLKDEHEPGRNGEKRNERINVDPAGWRNYKLNGKWINDRLHLVGYQFSGLNDELRNLVPGTAYLNRGTEGKGMNDSIPESMLFYENRLDQWLAKHKDSELDLYVAPIYEGENLTPTAIYMQWVGFDKNGNQIAINIGGKSQAQTETIYGVVLENKTPSFTVNYETGEVK